MNICVSKLLDHLCCTMFDEFFLGSRSGVAKSPALRAQNLWSVSVNSQQFASASGTRNGTDSTKSMHWSYIFHPNRRILPGDIGHSHRGWLAQAACTKKLVGKHWESEKISALLPLLAISCNSPKFLFRVASYCLITFKLQDEDDDEEDLFMSMRHGKPWKLSRRMQVFHGISPSNVAQRKAKKMMKRRRNLSGKAQLNACKIGSHFSQHCANSLNLTLILVKVWLRRHFVQRMRGSPLKALVRGRRTILDSGLDFERVRVLFCKFVVNSRERGKE